MTKPGAVVAITAARLDADGRGVGEAEGRTLRVAGLLPGERARVRVEHVSPHRAEAWGVVVDREGATDSADRVAPACPAHGRCGGCLLQHLAYPAQLAAKRRRLVEALALTLAEPPPVADCVAAPALLGYRNQGKYVAARDGGRLLLGAYEPASHRVVDTAGCRVVEPAIDVVAAALRALLDRPDLPVHDERTRAGCLRYVLVRATAGGRALAAIVTTSGAPRAALVEVAAALRARCPEVAGVVWVRNDAAGGGLLADDEELLAGDARIEDAVGPVPVRLGAGTFFQVNRAQAARLYADVAARAGGAGVALVDLYCGVGGIALTAALAGARVVGVERNPAAVAAAAEAAVRLGVADRAQFLATGADALAAACGALGGPPDVVVVDPPRRGLDDATRAALVAAAPPRILYVSCAPESLARDLAALAAAGWRAGEVTPYDLMPGTPEVEAVVELTR